MNFRKPSFSFPCIGWRFEQEIIGFDKENIWNANIMAAARQLLLEVSNPAISRLLVRIIDDLSPQRGFSLRCKQIPARHREWRPLHSLAVDLLNGLGINYKLGQAYAPGYLVSSWRVWEDFLTIVARLSFGTAAVAPQNGFFLGTRMKSLAGTKMELSVFPDIVIESSDNRPRIVLDAKYKGHIEKGQVRVTEADVYEAIAFSKATACDHIVLAYPAAPSRNMQSQGRCTVFEKIQVDTVKIIGIEVETRGISRRGALKFFAENFAADLAALDF